DGGRPQSRLQRIGRAGRSETAGIGDRALLRVEEIRDADDPVRYAGRIIKIIDRAKARVLGLFRAQPDGSGRLAPIDKKQLGRELIIPRGASGDAQDGELVAVEVAGSRSGFGLATARVKERLGSLKSERAVSMVAIAAHSIPNVFPPAVIKDAEAAQPARLAGRED